jgi:hypothetical protein
MNGQMEKEKQIEEMARDLSETYKGNDCLFTNACDICEYRKYQGNKEYPCGAMKHAKEMIVRGYRKQTCDVVPRSEVEQAKQEVASMIIEHFDNKKAREVVAVRYTMGTKNFSIMNPYTFANDISMETVQKIKEQNR